jgi:hypothetical protein
MKTVVNVLMVAACTSWICVLVLKKRDNVKHPAVEQVTSSIEPLTVVVLQDLSGSIQNNGVEIISSNSLSPLLKVTNRSLRICFWRN